MDIVGHAAQIDHVELTAALARLGLENAALDTGVYLGDLRVIAGDPAEDGDGLFLLDTGPIPPRQVLLILRRDGQSSVLSRRFVELLQTAGKRMAAGCRYFGDTSTKIPCGDGKGRRAPFRGVIRGKRTCPTTRIVILLGK